MDAIEKLIDDTIAAHRERGANSPISPMDNFEAQTIADAMKGLPKYEQEAIGAQAQPWNAGMNAANAFFGGIPARVAPQHIRDAHAAWNAANPTMGMMTELGGSLPLALGAGALGQEYIAGPIAARTAAMAPRLLSQLPRASQVLGEAFSGGVQGAAGNAATAGIAPGAGNSPGDYLNAAKEGALYGGIANPALRSVGRLAGLGTKIAPETANAAEAAINQGVNVRPGQLPGANWGQRLAEWMSGKPNGERQLYEKLTGVLGSPQSTIDQPWINATKRAHGAEMERITSSNPYMIDHQALNELAATRNNVPAMMGKEHADYVGKTIEKVAQDIRDNGGLAGIPSAIYHDWLKKGGTIDNALNHENPSVRNAATEIKSTLENAWERTLPAGEAVRWNHARQGYKFTSALGEQLKPGEPLDPMALMRAVASRTDGDYTRAAWQHPTLGPVNLGELAHGSTAMMKPGETAVVNPSSAQRASMGLGMKSALGMGALAGGMSIGGLAHDPLREVYDAIQHDPVGTIGPVALAGLGGYGALRGLGARMNSPAATMRIVEALRSAQRTGGAAVVRHFGGVNPLLGLMEPLHLGQQQGDQKDAR